MRLLNQNNSLGTLSIRQNEINMIAHIIFDDESIEEDTKYYPKDDTEAYIVEDLNSYHGYREVKDLEEKLTKFSKQLREERPDISDSEYERNYENERVRLIELRANARNK